MELIEEITNGIEKKKHVVGIFIDLKKAFDTINHNILLQKSERYGIRGVGLDWVSSYLRNRQLFVEIGQHKSVYMNITCGVPHGSVLGPKLFRIYINDMCRVSDILKFILFADYTNIFCSGDNLQQILEVITIEINKLKRWFGVNKLSLNISKTKIMLFGKYKINPLVELKIDNVKIERVCENKFLGVILDHKICWKPQIKYVKAKLAKIIAILNKARHILNNESMHILYNTFILPYLSYGVEIWGNTYKTNLQSISILQKRAIRIINNVGYLEQTNLLFLQSIILKFIDLVKFKTAQVMFKARNKLLPGNFQKIFFERQGGYNLREELNFKKINIRTTLKSTCISVCGVRLWNGLEQVLKHCINIKQFKMLYKNTLLKGYVDV